MRMRRAMRVVAMGVVVCAAAAGAQRGGPDVGWAEYGGTLEGQRFSAARQIDRESVGRLQPAWSVGLGEIEGPKERGTFEATPVLWRGTLYFSTPLDVVVAVDAATGRVRWSFDPKVDADRVRYIVTSRGVALWHAAGSGEERRGGACADRVLVATLDRRLMAVDARTGRLCRGFGDGGAPGVVDLAKGVYVPEASMLEYTSAPVVVGVRVVLGSSVADNQTVDTPSGAVRGFDVRTGREVWSWEPLPWAQGTGPHRSGAGNAWAPLAADAEHDLVFVPTGSASVDYYGGTRVGDDRDADSIVALRASTGEKVWAFQMVHHDLWDYDTASEPLLFDWRGKVPAVAVMNKTGMIYVFNRLTGEPLFPVEEREVPRSDVAGEQAWPTQPFSTLPPLVSMDFKVDTMPAGDAEDERFCQRLMKEVRYDGPFTPPSLQGTVEYPASLGGPNWGSSAFDPATGMMYTRVNSMGFLVWLSPQGEDPAGAPASGRTGDREELKSERFKPPDSSLAYLGRAEQKGTPYTLSLRALVGPKGAPCGGAPYGRLVATDLNAGRQVWSVAHGRMRDDGAGSVGMSGPMVTAGGLVFVAGTEDAVLRAYDAATGKELWSEALPGKGTGTPMTYVVRGRQYVVVATGDDREHALVAFSLK